MVNWRVTATTIYCDTVDDEVTLLVYEDGSAKCAGCRKRGGYSKRIVNLVKTKMRQSGRQVGCDGPECYRVIEYRDRLFAEEAQRGCSEQTAEGTGEHISGTRVAKGE